MGLEYIVHPQVFLGGLTALGPGIQGLTEQYPLLTTYNYWTSTASVDASAFPIPGTWSIYDNPNNSASFIVTVGGLVQTPDTYSINIINRRLTFNSIISAGIEIGATQLATAAPSSISYDYIESVNSVITNLTATSLTAIDGSIENLFVTNLTALSTTVNVIDIQYSELSGFDVTGNVNVFGNINVTDSLSLTGSFTANDINIATVQANDITTTNLTATNLSVINLTATNLSVINLTATNTNTTNSLVTSLTANNIATNNITVNGSISASGNLSAENLSKYFILSADLSPRSLINSTSGFFDTNARFNLLANKSYKLNYDLYFLSSLTSNLRYVLSASSNLNSVNCNFITTNTAGISGAAIVPQMASTFAVNTGIIVLPSFAVTTGVFQNSLVQTIIQTDTNCSFNIAISGSNTSVTPKRGSSRVIQLME